MAENKVTYLCVVRLLLDSTTVLEGLFGEYHSSSAELKPRSFSTSSTLPFAAINIFHVSGPLTMSMSVKY